jgi:hypothetical protein
MKLFIHPITGQVLDQRSPFITTFNKETNTWDKIEAIVKESYFFSATLRITGIQAGRVQFESTTRKKYSMFPTEFKAFMKTCKFGEEGYISGVFTFTSRGGKLGIKYLGEIEVG